MRKLLPRSSSNKSAGDEEEGEESSALDGGAQAGETSGETTGESNTDGPGDLQQEEPVSTSNKDNQTIMRFLGDKEKVRPAALSRWAASVQLIHPTHPLLLTPSR